MMFRHKAMVFQGVVLALAIVMAAGSYGGEISVQDHNPELTHVALPKKPNKVVSLVPEITQVLCALGVGDSVVGVTWLDTYPPEVTQKPIVGGFLAPSIERIMALDPDVIFVSPLHQDVRRRLAEGPYRTIELRSESILDLYRNIEFLGTLFDRQAQAEELVLKMRHKFDLVSRKVHKVPVAERKRVMRLMGRDHVMAPGDDSFQNDVIRAAGGIPPQWGKTGAAVEVPLEDWLTFNPQVLYGCEAERVIADKISKMPGWKDVEAVREGRISFFPCELTCQAAVHTADFAAWLASTIYKDHFSLDAHLVLPEKPVGSKSLSLPLDYVKSAKVVESTIFDFPNKSLVIELKSPMSVLSTLEGERSGIVWVGNHGFPPPTWGLGHGIGLKGLKKRICRLKFRTSQC
ncbi:ABC transporter substrate-binding protein [Desulfosoma sp.]